MTRNWLGSAMALVVSVLFAGTALAQEKVLKVGSTPTGVPFTFLDTKTNTTTGALVDLVNEVGREIGYKVEIETMQFSSLIAALTANKVDLISAAMYITPARAEVVSFSNPIYSYGVTLLVPKSDTRDHTNWEAFKGEVMGAQVGTVFVEPLQKTGLFTEVKVYKTIQDILADINNGRLKAGVADYPIAAYNLQQGLFPNVRLVTSYKTTIPDSIGMSVRKTDTELLAKVNAALDKLGKDGTTQKILAKWGLE